MSTNQRRISVHVCCRKCQTVWFWNSVYLRSCCSLFLTRYLARVRPSNGVIKEDECDRQPAAVTLLTERTLLTFLAMPLKTIWSSHKCNRWHDNSNVSIKRNILKIATLTNCHMRCMSAASGCYNPEWEVFENQNSVGASQYAAAQSVQECLDHCGSQSNCVGVDVDLTKQPPTCWPHLSADAWLTRNVYSQRGTNQYRLKHKCVNDTTGLDLLQIYSVITPKLR